VKCELSGNALSTVEGVEVLVHNNLVASTTTLARCDDREGKEELPNAIPPVTVLGPNLLSVT